MPTYFWHNRSREASSRRGSKATQTAAPHCRHLRRSFPVFSHLKTRQEGARIVRRKPTGAFVGPRVARCDTGLGYTESVKVRLVQYRECVSPPALVANPRRRRRRAGRRVGTTKTGFPTARARDIARRRLTRTPRRRGATALAAWRSTCATRRSPAGGGSRPGRRGGSRRRRPSTFAGTPRRRPARSPVCVLTQ